MAVQTKSVSKTSPREVLERAKAEGVEVVDVRFIDLPGTWQHFSLPLGELDVDSFKDGLGFDGSSIRGFQSIDESDMLLMPDPDSATITQTVSAATPAAWPAVGSSAASTETGVSAKTIPAMTPIRASNDDTSLGWCGPA